MDADSGVMLQQYELPARFSGCFNFASDVGALSGDLYFLFSCGGIRSPTSLHCMLSTKRVSSDARC